MSSSSSGEYTASGTAYPDPTAAHPSFVDSTGFGSVDASLLARMYAVALGEHYNLVFVHILLL